MSIIKFGIILTLNHIFLKYGFFDRIFLKANGFHVKLNSTCKFLRIIEAAIHQIMYNVDGMTNVHTMRSVSK